MTTNIILDIEMNVDLETLSAVRVYKLTGNNLKEQLKVVSRLLRIDDRHVTTIKTNRT